jgi:hypothetical protein
LSRPIERAADFAHAISAKDVAAAQAQCTQTGWSPDQDTPGSLYKQAVRKGMTLGAGVVLAEQDGRTALAVPLLRVDPAGEEHLLAGLHLLDTGTGLAGVTKNAHVAHLFVEGAISAPPSFESLPESPEAQSFVSLLIEALQNDRQQVLSDAASDTLESLRVLRQLAHLIEEQGKSVQVERSYALPAAGRFSVRIRVDDRAMYWMLQRAPGGGLQSRMLSTLGSFERLLDPTKLTPRPV